jgi:hypothetical protein
MDFSGETVGQRVVRETLERAAMAQRRADIRNECPLIGRWLRVITSHFTAGIKIRNGVATQSGPSLKYLIGKMEHEVRAECDVQKWIVEDCP